MDLTGHADISLPPAEPEHLHLVEGHPPPLLRLLRPIGLWAPFAGHPPHTHLSDQVKLALSGSHFFHHLSDSDPLLIDILISLSKGSFTGPPCHRSLSLPSTSGTSTSVFEVSFSGALTFLPVIQCFRVFFSTNAEYFLMSCTSSQTEGPDRPS